MDRIELDDFYREVSVEFSNPFANVGTRGAEKLKSFIKTATDTIKNAFTNIDASHPNGLYVNSRQFQQAVEKKTVVYSDLRPLTIYIPSYLKPNASLLELSLVLEESLDLCKSIINAPQEVKTITSIYLGNPGRLQDPILVTANTPETESLIYIEKEMIKLKEKNSKLMTGSGAVSEVPFKQVYARIQDYQKANETALKINNHYVDFTGRLQAFVSLVNDTNKIASDLVKKIETDEKYKVSGQVAEYIVQELYRLAKAVEWLGAALHNSQVFLKAIADTNIKLNRISAN